MLLGQLSLWFQNFFPFQSCPRIACEFPGFTSYHPSIFAKIKFKNHGGLLVSRKRKNPSAFLDILSHVIQCWLVLEINRKRTERRKRPF
jgi:hypothetical protein